MKRGRGMAIAKLKNLVSDLERYNRYMAGESLEQIAVADEIEEAQVRASIQRGEQQDAVRRNAELMRLKHNGAIENEKLRQKARREQSKSYLRAQEELLEGKQDVVRTLPDGGIEIDTIRDNTALSAGLEHFRKTTQMSPEKGQADAPANVVNVQLNQNNNQGAGGFDFEKSLQKIRKQQSETFQEGEVVE